MACYINGYNPPRGIMEPTELSLSECNEVGMWWGDTAINYSQYFVPPPADSDGGAVYNGSCAYDPGNGELNAYGVGPATCEQRNQFVVIDPQTYINEVYGGQAPGQSGGSGDTETVPLTIEDLLLPQRVPAEQYELVFNAFFFLPLTAYLVAWGYQTVISFFATKD